MAKRYYWLKLPDGFFRQKAIKKLRKIAGGDTYTIIYLKMLLVAMKQDGRLYFEGVEATFYPHVVPHVGGPGLQTLRNSIDGTVCHSYIPAADI